MPVIVNRCGVVFQVRAVGSVGSDHQMTVLPSISDHRKIEKLAGVVDDELKVAEGPQVRHRRYATLFIDDVVTQDIEPRIDALLHQDPVICRKIMLWVQIDSENGISRQS